MSYIQENLNPNEKILYSARVHPAIFLQSIVLFVITLALVFYSFSMVTHVSTPGFPTAEQTSSSIVGSLFLCFSAFLFLYSIFLGIQALIIMRTTELAITNRRVIAKTGFIRRHSLEILLPKIESVDVRQGILGRMLNFGTVTVTGTGGTREGFKAIAEPIVVRKKINQIIEHYTELYAQRQRVSSLETGGK